MLRVLPVPAAHRAGPKAGRWGMTQEKTLGMGLHRAGIVVTVLDMENNTTNTKFTRHAPGLYTDATDRWIISREDRGWYSIRRCLGYGPLLDGVTMFPDMGAIWYGDYFSLEEAKTAVLQMVANDYDPILDTNDAHRLADNTERRN